MKNLFSIFDIFGGGEGGRISAEDLKEILNNKEEITLIDVRTPAEFKDIRIPGSILVPLDTISGLRSIPYKGRIVIYCAAGVRSRKARKMFLSLGARDVLDLEGGIKAWVASGGDYIQGRDM